MRLVMISPPGAGKSSVANVLSKLWLIPHIAVGDTLRDHVQKRTALGVKIDELIKGGNFVDDDTINAMMKERLVDVNDYILDGYPRTVDQAKFYLREIHHPTMIVHLIVPEDVLIRRMLNRGRADDTEETIRKRFAIYEEVTAPVLDLYRPLSCFPTWEVEGADTIEESSAKVKAAVYQYLGSESGFLYEKTAVDTVSQDQ
jgi:adenylate kinase